MTKTPKENVPVATEPKAEQTSAIADVKPEQTSSPAPFNRAEIEKAFSNPMLKGFKKYLDPILTYMDTVEARLQAADMNFQKISEFLGKMEPLINLSAQLAQRQNQPQTQPQAPNALGGIEGILQLLPSLLKADSGDSELANLGKEALRSQINMSKAITDAVVSKITSKAVVQVAEAVSA